MVKLHNQNQTYKTLIYTSFIFFSSDLANLTWCVVTYCSPGSAKNAQALVENHIHLVMLKIFDLVKENLQLESHQVQHGMEKIEKTDEHSIKIITTLIFPKDEEMTKKYIKKRESTYFGRVGPANSEQLSEQHKTLFAVSRSR